MCRHVFPQQPLLDVRLHPVIQPTNHKSELNPKTIIPMTNLNMASLKVSSVFNTVTAPERNNIFEQFRG